MRKFSWLVVAVLVWASAVAEANTIKVSRSGAEVFKVAVQVQGDPAFAKALKRNLVLSGVFQIDPNGASIQVTGNVGGQVTVTSSDKGGFTEQSQATDAASARTEARRLADKMCERYGKQKGFASDRIAFVSKVGKVEELCVGYADGSDLAQVTHDKRASVGPRWKNASTIYYTGYLNNAPQIFEINADTCERRLAYGFGGLTTGATVSPDGSRIAVILSKRFGNPELCVINHGSDSWTRLTKTPKASEGQPSWSPDGRAIVYVSNQSVRQQLYIIDVASKQTRQLTTLGSQNVDPDWGNDGRIVYTTRRSGGNQIAIVSPNGTDRQGRLVTAPGRWEHPSWARDGRHVVAECDGALYLIDTEEPEGGELPKPVRLFNLPQGAKCITPSWCR